MFYSSPAIFMLAVNFDELMKRGDALLIILLASQRKPQPNRHPLQCPKLQQSPGKQVRLYCFTYSPELSSMGDCGVFRARACLCVICVDWSIFWGGGFVMAHDTDRTETVNSLPGIQKQRHDAQPFKLVFIPKEFHRSYMYPCASNPGVNGRT